MTEPAVSSIGLLAAKIAEMPNLAKKVLALHYHKNVCIEDVAVFLEFPETTIQEIHSKAVCSLYEYFLSLRVQISSKGLISHAFEMASNQPPTGEVT